MGLTFPLAAVKITAELSQRHEKKEPDVKKAEIKVGGHYVAKVSGMLTTVRVDSVREQEGYRSNVSNHRVKDSTVYDVTNLTTGRKLTFRSAAKFRSEIIDPKEIQ